VNKSQTEASTSPIPREAVATPEDVQKFLELTEEQKEEIRREQALRLYRSRALLTDNERRIGRGIELEKHHRITGNKDGLAEALALQGRYGEAAEVAVSDQLKAEYQEKFRAVEREDCDCSCDSFKQEGEFNLPVQYIEMYGHSVKHGGEVPFIRCTTCKELNAMPAPQHLIDQRTVRHSDLPDADRLKYFRN